jgi:ElaB/YqjD/DUF883 family membrane-anchored ribosome-binding protein
MAGEQRTTQQNQPWNAGSTGQSGSRPGAGGGATGLMEKTKDTASGVADKARDVASGAVDRAKDVASNVADKARDVASNVADTARDWASDVAQGAERAYGVTRDSVMSAEESVESFIRRYPVPTVLAAFVVGCLAGCAMSRRY